MEKNQQSWNSFNLFISSVLDEFGPDIITRFQVVIASLVLFLFQVEFTDFFMNVSCGQWLLADTLLPYLKTLQKGFLAVWYIATLLVQDTKVQKAISTGRVHNKFFLWTFGKKFLPYCKCFGEACNCLMWNFTFVIVNSDKIISVTGF